MREKLGNIESEKHKQRIVEIVDILMDTSLGNILECPVIYSVAEGVNSLMFSKETNEVTKSDVMTVLKITENSLNKAIDILEDKE